ncbi:phosphatidylethanolamine-binding protein 4 isoform X2 [Aphelocoma coerulescens]|uniref:phosphatidylethanolamine-binding protein 4 isoform X2 n=1 Tax=Aphelocoma coerulescens TaxID=39617 RepID=UPI0036052328
MKLLGAVLVALSLLLPGSWGSEASRTCIFQTLSESDSEFCRGDLEVIYPEVGDVSCSYIPKCHGYRRQLSHEWGKPHVRYPWAKKAGAAAVAGCQPGFGAEGGSRAVAASGSRCQGMGSVSRCHRSAGDARSRRRCEGPNEIKADMSTELHRAFPTGIGRFPSLK